MKTVLRSSFFETILAQSDNRCYDREKHNLEQE